MKRSSGVSANRSPDEQAFAIVQRAINQAFARVAQLCRHVRAGDTETIHRTRIAFKRFRYMVEALAPLLPAVTPDHRRAMRGYQCMMGDIQDMEVLLAALDKFVQKEGVNASSAHRLKKELVRWRQLLIQIYLNAAGRLRRFWPPPGLRQPTQKRRTKPMNLYLLRHGIAAEPGMAGYEPDSERPLTPKGESRLRDSRPGDGGAWICPST